MFVFRREDLPSDPEFPAHLEKLGYFINHKDQIRKISDPTQEFQFKINKNSRWNDLHKEAMNSCIRENVYSRLRDLGLGILRLPLYSGPKKPSVPILVSRNLSTAQRIIVVFGEPVQDLGIWAYRTIGSRSISEGSALAFAKAVLEQQETKSGSIEYQNPHAISQDPRALVLANPGQLVWHCASGRAMTLQSWFSLPRPSAVDPPPVMSKRNEIPNNKTWQEHINCVFNEILAARGRLVRQDVKIDVIGLSEGGLGAIRYLSKNWSSWYTYVSAIALVNPLHSTQIDLVEPEQTAFPEFMSSRCRAYLLSDQPLGIPLPDTRDYGCNCYSSGEPLNIECMMPGAWRSILEWLDRMYEYPDCSEPQREFREEGVKTFAEPLADRVGEDTVESEGHASV